MFFPAVKSLYTLQGNKKGVIMTKKQKPFKHLNERCWGRQVAIYINRHKKWLKIGIWCNRCGSIWLESKFKKGLPGR